MRCSDPPGSQKTSIAVRSLPEDPPYQNLWAEADEKKKIHFRLGVPVCFLFVAVWVSVWNRAAVQVSVEEKGSIPVRKVDRAVPYEAAEVLRGYR